MTVTTKLRSWIFVYQRSTRIHDIARMENPALSALPSETLHEIQASLGYASQLALRLTCRELHAKLIDPAKPITLSPRRNAPMHRTYDIYDLLEIEKWPAYAGVRGRPEYAKQPIAGHDFFACSLCLKLRSAGKFSNAMMKGKRGKLGSGTVEERRSRTFAELRQCIEEEWAALSLEDIRRYIGSMRERCQAVVDAKGGHTKW